MLVFFCLLIGSLVWLRYIGEITIFLFLQIAIVSVLVNTNNIALALSFCLNRIIAHWYLVLVLLGLHAYNI